jgi:menaquinol-cytochrome c reductase iron-sulfur subunit
MNDPEQTTPPDPVPTQDSGLGTQDSPDRRAFMRKSLAVLTGAVAVGIPTAAGVVLYTDPLRRRSTDAGYIHITALDGVPDDGLPHRFPVIADKTNVWTVEKNVPIGSVYLRRGGSKVVAWTTVCPHLGCSIDAKPDGTFHCPCHNSGFGKDGQVLPGAVSPRGMDTLDVDPVALEKGEVRVKWQNFVASVTRKIAQL